MVPRKSYCVMVSSSVVHNVEVLHSIQTIYCCVLCSQRRRTNSLVTPRPRDIFREKRYYIQQIVSVFPHYSQFVPNHRSFSHSTGNIFTSLTALMNKHFSWFFPQIFKSLYYSVLLSDPQARTHAHTHRYTHMHIAIQQLFWRLLVVTTHETLFKGSNRLQAEVRQRKNKSY